MVLDLLRIRNLALIEDVELEFSPGLNVMTGESGAGKSFILKALEFILGQRLDADMIRSGAERASVEALFRIGDQETVIRRELVGESGRSRVYIDGSLGSQARITQLRPGLLIHASQHGQQQLLRPSFHTRIVDSFLPDERMRRDFSRELRTVQDVRQDLAGLDDRVRELEKQRDFLEFQLAEIQKVGPGPGEEEELLHERDRLKKLEETSRGMERCLEMLHGGMESGLLALTEELAAELGGLSAVDEDFAAAREHLTETVHVLRDLDMRLRRRTGEENPAAGLDRIESRLFELSRLRKKLNRTLDQIVDLADEIESNLSFLDKSRLERQVIARRLDERLAGLARAAGKLNQGRRQAAKILGQRLEESLQELGFPEAVRVVFNMESSEVEQGIVEERPVILWVPNPGQAPQPLDRIASGGELSRFFLALVGLWGAEGSQTLLFDEVDAGIGGVTLNRVAKAVQNLAARQQVILITHWPQLAAGADRHFRIEKTMGQDFTTTHCRRLDEEERIQELARMAGGGSRGMRLAREYAAQEEG